MIVVRVELHSAITGRVTELARAHIFNVGGTQQLGDYGVRTFRGRCTEALDRGVIQRCGKVDNHPRLALHVWHLVVKALIGMGYGGARSEATAPADGRRCRSAATKRRESALLLGEGDAE